MQAIHIHVTLVMVRCNSNCSSDYQILKTKQSQKSQKLYMLHVVQCIWAIDVILRLYAVGVYDIGSSVVWIISTQGGLPFFCPQNR